MLRMPLRRVRETYVAESRCPLVKQKALIKDLRVVPSEPKQQARPGQWCRPRNTPSLASRSIPPVSRPVASSWIAATGSSLDGWRRRGGHDVASLVRDQVLVGATPALQRGFHAAPSEFQGFGVVRERGGGQFCFGAAPNRGRACVSRGQPGTFGASGNRHKRGVTNNRTAFEGPAAIWRQFLQGSQLRLRSTPRF